MTASQGFAKEPRTLTPHEYEQAYARLTAVALRYGAQFDAHAAHDALTEALAAIGVAAPPPQPTSESSAAGRTAGGVMWLLSDDEGARHGGFVLGRLADDSTSALAPGQAQRERQFTDDSTAYGGTWLGPELGVPSEQPLALVPGCACGWRGPDLPYDPAGGVCGNGTCYDGQSVDAHRLWKAHAQAALSTDTPQERNSRLCAVTAPARTQR
ncbi:hypothetical protein ACFC0M_37120 [Streptomyces sp. NPDC056149]|uniref:hypothetical protein n=1 Tax=unclassified Streptomyces TaxID=2593676 RepID=UPI002380C8DA|nr:hypothetical protein [Streptomyces sp. WZ-12]